MAAPPDRQHSRSVILLYIRATALPCMAVIHPRTRRPQLNVLSLRYRCAEAGTEWALAAAPAHHSPCSSSGKFQNRCPSVPRAWCQGAILPCARPPDHPRLSTALCVQYPPDSSDGDGRQAPDLLSSMHPARRPDSSKELTVSDVCFFLQVREAACASWPGGLPCGGKDVMRSLCTCLGLTQYLCLAWDPGTKAQGGTGLGGWRKGQLRDHARGSSGARQVQDVSSPAPQMALHGAREGAWRLGEAIQRGACALTRPHRGRGPDRGRTRALQEEWRAFESSRMHWARDRKALLVRARLDAVYRAWLLVTWERCCGTS